MCALGIYYPQYWLTNTFEANIETIPHDNKEVLGTYGRKDWGCWGASASTPCCPQDFIFKITMILDAQAAMSLPMIENPMSCLWCKLSNNALISMKFSEVMKVVEIAHVQVLSSVENERTFNSLSFLKSRLRNRLTTHLHLVVCMFPWFLHLKYIPLPRNNIILESSKAFL